VAQLELRGVGKSFGNPPVRVVKGVDLSVADGEFMVFVGPSGCGKTTTLRMIAGLEEISEGDVLIGGERVNDIAAAQRGVAMVFQSYALYPHMTVAQNMGFGLRLGGASPAEVDAQVRRAAAILQLESLLDRKPKALSGGQRQRVAIGRAIVRAPRVFLFDEPLSNLDAALRVQMRAELIALHQRLGTTMVYVTHDQVEAMTLGDRIAVFHAGRIEQCGSPMELYQRPANRFVAGFIGSPGMNFFPAQALPGTPAQEVGVRPEHLTLGTAGSGLAAQVLRVEQLGSEQFVHLRAANAAGGGAVVLRLEAAAQAPAPGDNVGVLLPANHLHLFDEQGDRLPQPAQA
jgi:multiple sugar transport system ATP-binding protein